MTEETTAAASDAPPTCYRHKGRETHVRCTRCDRPICPDCMNTAAVGFQCPECVKEGNKTVRQARTLLGGRVGTGETHVTKALVALNVVAFLAQMQTLQVTLDYAAKGDAIAYGEYHRLVTSAFLHSPSFLLHIVFNMYALLLFGSQVERLTGAVRFLALYLVAALGGSVASLVFSNPLGYGVGASGAVFGLFGAFFVITRKLGNDTSQIVGLIAFNLVFGALFSQYIDNWAHLGGLATGAAIAFVYAQVPRGRWRPLLQLAGTAAIVAVLAAVTVVRSSDIKQRYREPVRPVVTDVMPETTSATGAPSR